MQFVSLRCYCYGKTRQMWSHGAIRLKSYDLGQMALFDDFDFLFPFHTHLLSETILLPCPLIAQVHNAFPHEKEWSCTWEWRDISTLLTLYDKDEIFLDPSTYSNLFISCDELKLNDDRTYADPPYPNFFDPLSPDRSHVDQIDWERIGDRKRRCDCFQEEVKFHMRDPSEADQSVIETLLRDGLDVLFLS